MRRTLNTALPRVANGSYVARSIDGLDARASSVSDVPRIGIRVVVASSRNSPISLLSSRITLPMSTEWDVSLRRCECNVFMPRVSRHEVTPTAYVWHVHLRTMLARFWVYSQDSADWGTRSASTNGSARIGLEFGRLSGSSLMGPFSCIVYQSSYVAPLVGGILYVSRWWVDCIT